MAKVAIISSAIYLIMLLLMMESATIAIASQASVKIINDVGDPIRVHCKSGDEDFGEKTLVATQSFAWGFTPSIWGRTLYYCSFIWDSQRKITKNLRVWVDYKLFSSYDSDHQPCTHCVWSVAKEGFFRMTSDTREKLPVFESGWLNP